MMLLSYHQDVRTTLTLDDDVARLLSREARRSGLSFKEAVNRYLRLGLAGGSRSHARPQPFVVSARPLGLPPGWTYDNVAELLEKLEGDQP